MAAECGHCGGVELLQFAGSGEAGGPLHDLLHMHAESNFQPRTDPVAAVLLVALADQRAIQQALRA